MSTVDEILVTKLARIQTDGGDVLKVLDREHSTFSGFGEAYFSLINYGVKKGTKRHLRMTMNLTVPVGLVEFVFVDEHGKVRTEVIGEMNYCRLTVPNNIWFSFKGLAEPHSIILNIADCLHDPYEVESASIDFTKG